MLTQPAVIRMKTSNTLYLIVIAALYLISRRVFMTKAVSRHPNQTLYNDILDRDRNSVNLTMPTVPKESKVIVVVCSKLGDVEIRSTIRRTWANPLLSSAVYNKVITVLFLLGSGHMNDAVKEERQKFSDILQVDVYDSYSNLIYKLLAAYRWIEYNYPNKFVLKIDSDVVIVLDKLAVRLGNPNEKSLHCYVIHKKKPNRNAGRRWYIPESVYPGYYLPDYCFGAAYLFNPAALSAILDVSLGVKVFEVEDAFFTGVLANKAGINLRKERGMWPRWDYIDNHKNAELFAKLGTLGGG